MDVLCGTQERHATLISHNQLHVSQHQLLAENATRYPGQTGSNELTVMPAVLSVLWTLPKSPVWLHLRAPISDGGDSSWEKDSSKQVSYRGF